MGILKENIESTNIIVELNSSKLKAATYNTSTKDLIVTFKNNSEYEFNKVPWDIFTKFRMTESQGKFFTTEIKNNYTYKKLK